MHACLRKTSAELDIDDNASYRPVPSVPFLYVYLTLPVRHTNHESKGRFDGSVSELPWTPKWEALGGSSIKLRANSAQITE